MKRRMAYVVIMLAFLLVSCDPGIQTGYVYAHRIHPAWVQVIPGESIRTCTGNGKRTVCYTNYDPPVVIEHPTTYELDISNCKHNVGSSECKTNALYVSEYEYDRYPIGAYYGGAN